jgi:hypothetical protein
MSMSVFEQSIDHVFFACAAAKHFSCILFRCAQQLACGLRSASRDGNDIIRADTSFSYSRPHPQTYARARARYPLRAPIHARARYPRIIYARGFARARKTYTTTAQVD